MSLSGALQIGQSSLSLSSTAIQLVGNNMANAATPGYSRQGLHAVPGRDQRIGPSAFVGTGVRLGGINRYVDEVLLTRTRFSMSDESFARTETDLLSQIEVIQGELSDTDISTALGDFFNAWSELANQPNNPSMRTLVVGEGARLADHLQYTRSKYVELRDQIDSQLKAAVSTVSGLFDKIAQLNASINQAEGGSGTASSLRDQQDLLLDELSGYLNIEARPGQGGMKDVYIGSLPLVIGSDYRGLEMNFIDRDGARAAEFRLSDDGSLLQPEGGTIGGLLQVRADDLERVIDDIDALAHTLIWDVNRIHSQGQGQSRFSDLTGAYIVTDPDAPLNSDQAGLPFEISNGSFRLHVTEASSGLRSSFRIDLDLDGIGSDTTLNDLVDQINSAAGPAGVTASVTIDGRLNLTASGGRTISFSDDTAGALASLGLNTYFTGENAADIGVNEILEDDSSLLAVGADHIEGSNDTALNISKLSAESQSELGGETIEDFWRSRVESQALRQGQAQTRLFSAQTIRESLEAQVAVVSGVSLDEEAINLVKFEQQYQAAARFVSTVDRLMQELLAAV